MCLSFLPLFTGNESVGSLEGRWLPLTSPLPHTWGWRCLGSGAKLPRIFSTPRHHGPLLGRKDSNLTSFVKHWSVSVCLMVQHLLLASPWIVSRSSEHEVPRHPLAVAVLSERMTSATTTDTRENSLHVGYQTFAT